MNFYYSIFIFVSNVQIPKLQKAWYIDFHVFKTYSQNNMFKDAPIISCIFLKYSGDKYGVRGFRFGHMFGRSKNVPKSIAIDQKSLIRDFGTINTPKKHNYSKSPRTNETCAWTPNKVF